ncbi:uncharacterized protein LOC129769448 [Toxorhynchites rutilus septentrionalis]|uniref:uncharacterized protein LOC129769448 n=1 Tax=Toxorhynchites rutilus septentrionalis TaxID=329112 RepID=UPI00247AD12F|nr:uncharacterized protein LOC129769448 [Toxorhynchites rutilus septentrionalis]
MYKVCQVLHKVSPIAQQFTKLSTQRSVQTSAKVHKNKNTEPESKDEPIKYFNSTAARWKAQQTRSGHVNEDVPWFQPYAVIASVSAFLLYFCVLREENDIDRDLERSLFDQVPGLEEKQLLLTYHYNKERGLSTIELEQRMKELGIVI